VRKCGLAVMRDGVPIFAFKLRHQCAIASFIEEKLQQSFSSVDCKLFVALIQEADFGVAARGGCMGSTLLC